MHLIDAVVVGGGVVGLACAVSLARRELSVMVLEAAPLIGTGTSSRNSEVIHAGLYYPEGSLKARLCVEGRDLLYTFCSDRGVAHRRTGKLIFAAHPDQQGQLDLIAQRAAQANVDDVRWLTPTQVCAIEPELRCAGALLSPSSGIVDAHGLMLALAGELDALYGQVVCNTRVSGAARHKGRWLIRCEDEKEPVLAARMLVNSGGLHATEMARTIEGLSDADTPERVLARGCYFGYAGRVPFRHLIYPVPASDGLGTHLTLDLAGRARFGPNVEWVENLDYSVDPALHPEFLAAARLIWSGIDADALQPAYAGIRPKVRTSAGIATDFLIRGPTDHGLEGLVNLFGIESPGLTASLAIGELVAAKLGH